MARDPSKAEKANAQTKPGRYALGGGLYLQVTPSGTKSYLYRYKLHGVDRHMGLGPVWNIETETGIKLPDARKAAAKKWLLVRDGVDPLAEKKAGKLVAKLKRARVNENIMIRLEGIGNLAMHWFDYVPEMEVPDVKRRLFDYQDGK